MVRSQNAPYVTLIWSVSGQVRKWTAEQRTFSNDQ
jgi:hypothetical protein